MRLGADGVSVTCKMARARPAIGDTRLTTCFSAALVGADVLYSYGVTVHICPMLSETGAILDTR